MKHDNVASGHIHTPFNWLFTTASERNASTGQSESDTGKLAIQFEDMTLWILVSIEPNVWMPVGGSVTIAWTDVTGKPTEFPPASHDHPFNSLTGLDIPNPVEGQVLTFDGDTWIASDPPASSGGGSSVLEVQVFS